MNKEELSNSEPCSVCGRESAEWVCALAPDFPDEELDLNEDYCGWDPNEEKEEKKEEELQI